MQKNIFLASEVRSGSTLLGELIAYNLKRQTGYDYLDLTREHFASTKSETDDIEVVSNFEKLRQMHGNDSIMLTKLQCKELSVLHQKSTNNNDIKDILYGESSYWIYIIREDTLSQAASLAIARSTDKWHEYDDADGVNLPCDVQVSDIYKALKDLNLSNVFLKCHHKYTQKRSLANIFITYEELLESPSHFIDNITDLLAYKRLGMSDKQTLELACLKKQDQKLKKDLIEEFSADFLSFYN